MPLPAKDVNIEKDQELFLIGPLAKRPSGDPVTRTQHSLGAGMSIQQPS